MTLIDTSAWIEFLRRHGDLVVKSRVAAFVEMGEAAYCGPIEFELLAGAKPREMPDVRAALNFSTLLAFPQDCWRRSAEIEKRLRGQGITVPRDDVFVGAAALYHDVAIFSCDPHFALMRDGGGLPLSLVS